MVLKGFIVIPMILLSGWWAEAKGKPSILSASSVEIVDLVNRLDVKSDFSIAKVSFSPSQAKQGDKVTVFVELSTDFESNKNIKAGVSATLNGQKLRLNRRAGNLWTSLPMQVHQIGGYTLEVSAYIEDIEANRIVREQLNSLLHEIAKLQVEYARETNQEKKDLIQQVIDSKISQKMDLENALEASKKSVANRAAILDVGPGDSNSPYPRLTGCVPDAGALGGGVEVVLAGVNMHEVSAVMIGGVVIPASQIQTNGDAITFSTPALARGIHDISIVSQVAQREITTTLHNAYYAGDVGASNGGDLPPIAFAGYPRNILAEQPTQLDGTMSYDEEGKSLTYEWSVVSFPAGASAWDWSLVDGYTAVPTFSAKIEGNYILSLTVNNGEKDSIPSWTIVTVGPKGAISVTPSSIIGSYRKDTPFVGMFKICNHLPQDGKYQIYLTDISLLSGSNRGTILRNSCLSFQFVSHYKPSGRSFSIPIAMTGPTSVGTRIEVNLSEEGPRQATLHTTYNNLQWTGETNLELISEAGVVPILGTYDEDSETLLEIRNHTDDALYIPSGPTLTYLDGSSGVYEVPSGPFFVDPKSSLTIVFKVKPSGSFTANGRSEALLTWKIEPLNAPAITAVLSTRKISYIDAAIKLLDFGNLLLNNVSAPKKINLLREVFLLPEENWLMEVENISSNFEGCFLMDEFWPGDQYLVGVQPNLSAMDVDVLTYFKPVVEGLCEGEISFKLNGSQAPITYELKGTGVVP